MSNLDQSTTGVASAADYAAIVHVFYDAMNTGDIASLDRAFAPDWVDNTLPPDRLPGLEGIKAAIQLLRNILPDLVCKVEDVLIAGDKVVVRAKFTGTNQGGFMGVSPTNSPVQFIAIDIHHIADGRITESWHLEDNLSFLLQLGVVSLPG